ncbi:MAG: hypothetical protein ACKVOR_14130 [Flavobacteriales bacterium]
MAKQNRHHKKKMGSEEEFSKDSLKLNYWRLVCSKMNLASVIYSQSGSNWRALNEAMGRHHGYMQETLAKGGDMPLSTAMCITNDTDVNVLAMAIDQMSADKQETTLTRALRTDMAMMAEINAKLEKKNVDLEERLVHKDERIAELERTVELLAKGRG